MLAIIIAWLLALVPIDGDPVCFCGTDEPPPECTDAICPGL